MMRVFRPHMRRCLDPATMVIFFQQLYVLLHPINRSACGISASKLELWMVALLLLLLLRLVMVKIE